MSVKSNVTEKWIKSHCQQCFNACPIEVLVRDQRAVRIKGDPDDPYTMGHLCARGLSGIAKLYDPERLKKPMKRTNPVKELGVDPGWEEISWEQALDEIAVKLKKIRTENPNKLICSMWPWEKYIQSFAWGTAFGTKNGGFSFSGVSNQCANPNHFIGMLSHGALVEFPDMDYCKYLIVFGSEFGTGSHQLFVRNAMNMADAREKGMKTVVVDPRLSVGAGKADVWIPIKPATDLAFLLSMIYLLLHELKTFDTPFLKKNTNAPYLLDDKEYFVIDPESKKPLVWDLVDNVAKPFDDPGIKDYALEGSFFTEGVACRPAFEFLKEKTSDYTPEWAAGICETSADLIRRITSEFAEAAEIGKTINIDGKEYPLRPAALLSYRGLQAHTNGGIAMMAQATVMMLIGALGAPGGLLAKSMDDRRFGGSPAYLKKGEDGIVRPHATGWEFKIPFVYPPERLDLREYCPLAFDMGHLTVMTTLDPERYGLTYKPEALVTYHANPITNAGDLNMVTEALKKLDMMVSINVYLDESTDFADYVLPEPSYLERYNLSNFSFDQEGLQIAQPVVEPLGDTMEGMDILIELAHRAEFLFGEDGFNTHLNRTLGLTSPHILDLNTKYTYQEILNQQALCHSGGKKDLSWYMKNGNNLKQLRPDQKYCYYQDARMPLFFNHIKHTGYELKDNLKRFKIEEKYGLNINLNQYEGFPYWEPSPIHEDHEYDMYMIAYKSYLTTYVDMATNPLIMDIVESDPYHLRVMINTRTAQEKGFADGDRIWIESRLKKLPARVKLSQGIHPATLAVSQGFGRMGRHSVARGRGVEYNPHLPISLTYSGFLGGSMESAAKVRIYKRSEGGKTCDTE